MDAVAAQVEALRRIRAVITGEPVPTVPAGEAPEVMAAIGEEFAAMREAAGKAAGAWALGYIEGQIARVLLASMSAPEDLAE
jgi:hypothetical protein